MSTASTQTRLKGLLLIHENTPFLAEQVRDEIADVVPGNIVNLLDVRQFCRELQAANGQGTEEIWRILFLVCVQQSQSLNLFEYEGRFGSLADALKERPFRDRVFVLLAPMDGHSRKHLSCKSVVDSVNDEPAMVRYFPKRAFALDPKRNSFRRILASVLRECTTAVLEREENTESTVLLKDERRPSATSIFLLVLIGCACCVPLLCISSCTFSLQPFQRLEQFVTSRVDGSECDYITPDLSRNETDSANATTSHPRERLTDA